MQRLWVYVAPLVLPWVLLFAFNSAHGLPLARTQLPRVARDASRCNWECHNRGCSHRPKLPAVLTSDRSVFGATIHGLYTLGRLFSRDRFEGYGIANLIVFCVLWPTVMYALWVRVWLQRYQIRQLRLAATTGEP